MTRISKKKLFIKLSKYDEEKPDEYKVVHISEFKGEYEKLIFTNGGSWCRKSEWKKYKVATLKFSRKINYLWDAEEKEKKNIKEIFDNCPLINRKYRHNKIIYIGVFGLLQECDKNRYNIRKDIKDYYRDKPCCACGQTSDLTFDHKNDLYNDKRVLNPETQTIQDFQRLCNSCNLKKRTICIKTKEKKERYGATQIPHMKVYGIDFISGDKSFDPDDINAMKGTYWYDPIEFHKKVKEIIENNAIKNFKAKELTENKSIKPKIKKEIKPKIKKEVKHQIKKEVNEEETEKEIKSQIKKES